MDQNLAWLEIWKFAKSVGADIPDWKQMKKVWNSWKQNARKKKKMSEKTGQGAKGTEFTKIEQLIFDILGGTCNVSRAKVILPTKPNRVDYGRCLSHRLIQ